MTRPGIDGETGELRVADSKDPRRAERSGALPNAPGGALDAVEEQHEAGTREVEMYIRTYQSLLRSSGEVGVKALVQAH
jgi:hypothetical protein